jgi:hypothetical protein
VKGANMNIPAATHPAWMDVITGKVQHQFEFFAAKMCIQRLILNVKQDPSPATINKCVTELRDIFLINSNLPKVKNDLEKIFGKGVVA